MFNYGYMTSDEAQHDIADLQQGQSTEWISVRTSSTKSEQVTLPRRSGSENYKLLPIFDATKAFTRLPWTYNYEQEHSYNQ